MNRVFRLPLAGLVLLLAACEPKPSAPPEQDEANYWHEFYFGSAIAKDPAITWRSSGLGIRVITPGEGRAPGMTDRIRVHYTGKLKDGTVFADSHAGAGKPSDFVVNRLIPGWAAAMPSLKPGGHAVFYIPPQLGYGGMQSGKIPPHAGLIFDVELIAVNPSP
ncbi:MAG TPA: FKBP-type peptidyl-prolyl cis-trans isomerase [Lacunisphaera sp.]|jgi:FKBP-type peptidyl-prolyl cis-trans isomerase|nr:FKBP-type peptidyl-prolyl cis-trans isomerase [Lacunisphaera sp.]